MPRYLPTPEEALLLRAAVWPPEGALAAWQSWLTRNDIDDTRKAALDLYPAIFRNIGGLLMDEHARGTLHGVYRRTWLQNQVNLNRAASVIKLLEGHGIATVVLKGGALVGSVYRDPGARPMADVDLLVPTARAQEAYSLLLADGWTGERDHRGDMTNTVQVIRSVDLQKPDGTRLDLHWHVLLECCDPGDDDDFWADAVTAQVGTAETLRLSYEDMLLHILVHGSYWSDVRGVTWAADAFRIIETAGGSFDWARLQVQATKRALTLPVSTGLTYLREALGAEVPPPVLTMLEKQRVTLTERLAFRAQDVRSGAVLQIYRDFADYLLRSRRRSVSMRLSGWVWYLKAVLGLRSSWHVPVRLAFLAARRPLRMMRQKSPGL